MQHPSQTDHEDDARRDERGSQFDGLEFHCRQLNKKPEQHKAALVWESYAMQLVVIRSRGDWSSTGRSVRGRHVINGLVNHERCWRSEIDEPHRREVLNLFQ